MCSILVLYLMSRKDFAIVYPSFIRWMHSLGGSPSRGANVVSCAWDTPVQLVFPSEAQAILVSKVGTLYIGVRYGITFRS